MLFIYLLCVVFILIYYLLKRRDNHWPNRKVFFRKSGILGETTNFMLRKQTLSEIYNNVYKEHADQKYVGIVEFTQPKLFLRDPELMNQVLVKDFSYFHDRQKAFDVGGRLIYSVVHLTGDKWKNARNKLTPVFSQYKLKLMYGLVEQCSAILINKHLRQAATNGEFVDVKELMTKFTLDVIGTCAFGMQFNMLETGNEEFLKIARTIFKLTPVNLFRGLIQNIDPNLIKWFGLKHFPDETENFFFNLLKQTEELRKIESNRRNDFVQLMLDIRDEERNNSDSLFTDEHIASNMLIFFSAGHETTAITLSFLLYEVAVNPEIQEKAREEIQNILKKHNGRLDYESTKELKYLDMVIAETLRMHSPVSATLRQCNKTYQLPGTPLILKPGDQVICPISPLQYDEKYYSNPHKFDPERFTEENIAKRPPYTYIPFGDGPRICLGLRFAKMEMKCCLVSLLSQYQFSVCSKTEIPPKYSLNTFFHTVDNGIWLTVEKLIK